MIWILSLYVLNTILMVVVAVREVRRPANALLWLLFCLIFPFIGFTFYLITSNPKSIPHKTRLPYIHVENQEYPPSVSKSIFNVSKALQRLSVSGMKVGQVQVLTNGEQTYDCLLTSIKKARKTIDIEYYIYRDDNIGRKVMSALIQKAEEGLKIRFLIDGWGSRKFPQTAKDKLMQAGIEFRTMFPLRFPWIVSTLNFRDHCKIVLIDGNEAFTGGINIGDEYMGLNPKVDFWRDTDIRILGEACKDLNAIFNTHWTIASPEKTSKESSGQAAKQLLAAPRESWMTELGTDLGSASEQTLNSTVSNTFIQTIEGNPGLPTQMIRQAFFLCLTQASKTIDITTPYFVPDEDIITALKTSAARGIRVRLLVPLKSDEKIVTLASRTFYGELLEAGVNIYQYSKGILHSKVMIVDGEMVEVGAANLDIRSFRLNYEVCNIIYSKDVAKLFINQFEQDLKVSVPLSMEDLSNRSSIERIKEQAARLLSPLI